MSKYYNGQWDWCNTHQVMERYCSKHDTWELYCGHCQDWINHDKFFGSKPTCFVDKRLARFVINAAASALIPGVGEIADIISELHG